MEKDRSRSIGRRWKVICSDRVKDVHSYVRVGDGYTVIKSDAGQFKDSQVYAAGSFPVKYFPSVNTMYLLPTAKTVKSANTGRKVLDPKHKATRSSVLAILSNTSSPTAVPQDDDIYLTIELGYYLASHFKTRDLDNMLKFIIDTLSEFYNFNDKRVIEIKAYKRPVTNTTKEILFYRISRNTRPSYPISANEL